MIQPALRTVRKLRDTFSELKQQAERIGASIQAVERGYFSASEDDDVSALLATYALTRAASLDLINELRQEQPAENPERSLFFLIGFSAALTLVDGAEFLMSLAQDRPVVRRKLNQPLPNFNLPGGTCDQVKRSLLGVRNRWRLAQARWQFQCEREHLIQIAEQYQCLDLVEWIDAHAHRADVSKRWLLHNRMRMRASQCTHLLLRTLLGGSLYRIQRFTSSMMADVYVKPGHSPGVPEEIVQQIKPILNPGDVLVVRKEFALTNYFLPGYWPHAALHLGTPEQLTTIGAPDSEHGQRLWERIVSVASTEGHCVLEAMKDGVQLRCLQSPLASDSFVVLRPQLPALRIHHGVLHVLAHEGKGYDFDFDFARSDQLVCTEVIYRAFDGQDGITFPLQRRAGRPTLAGADLVQMATDRKGFEIVAAYIPEQNRQLLTHQQADRAVRQVLASDDAASRSEA